MSILSAQCDRLRSLANNLRQTSRGHKEYISAMRDVADTIWKLRNTNLDMANENDDLKAENEELRERVAELEELTDGKRYIPQEWYAQLMAENAKLRQQLADVTESMSRVEERCAKLRELVCKVEHFESAGCFECPHSCGGFLYDDSCLMRREIEQDKRALGIEVVDAS